MQRNELEKLVVSELDALGFECVKLEVAGTRNPVVRLYIDKPGGVTISDCSKVGRSLGILLDESDPFPGRYLLEVSSPGNNRPLTTEAHFQRFAGKLSKITARSTETGKITYTGTIRSCITGVVTLDTDDGEVVVPLDSVLHAQLIQQEYKIDKKMTKDRRGRSEDRKDGET